MLLLGVDSAACMVVFNLVFKHNSITHNCMIPCCLLGCMAAFKKAVLSNRQLWGGLYSVAVLFHIGRNAPVLHLRCCSCRASVFSAGGQALHCLALHIAGLLVWSGWQDCERALLTPRRLLLVGGESWSRCARQHQQAVVCGLQPCAWMHIAHKWNPVRAWNPLK